MTAGPGNTQQNRVRVQRVRGLNQHKPSAERTATLTLASCVLLLLLLVLIAAGEALL